MNSLETFKSKDAESKISDLPESATLVNTFTISIKARGDKVELPLYEYGDTIGHKDGEKEIYYRYVLGWPKDFLCGEIKSLVEASPYWGKVPKFTDENCYYYDIAVDRQVGAEIPKEEIKKRVAFYWDQGKKAFAFLDGSSKKSK
ncbi:MAG: hypothetical protein HY226_01245 [Candidatus Vogelbacteria bacterium]|nr:hypothetical protein [Candidatus Vogelbacteria bacterium]